MTKKVADKMVFFSVPSGTRLLQKVYIYFSYISDVNFANLPSLPLANWFVMFATVTPTKSLINVQNATTKVSN
jgi:hypothetical protein